MLESRHARDDNDLCKKRFAEISEGNAHSKHPY